MYYKKLTALLVSVCLFSTGVSAAPSPRVPSSQLSGLSPKIGYVEETWQGTNGKTVYLIRDAHDSVEAQENIAKLIDYLVSRQGVETVYEEGYEGNVPTDLFFQDIQDRSTREQVSRQLLEELRIGGAEYAHINRWNPVVSRQSSVVSKEALKKEGLVSTHTEVASNSETVHSRLTTDDRRHDFRLIGADSLRGHLQNILDYRNAARAREEILEDLNAIRKEQDRIIAQRFPESTREWLKMKARFEQNRLDLAEYLRRSFGIYVDAHSKKDFISNYPQLTLFLKALESKNAELIQEAKKIRGHLFNHELRLFEKELAKGLLKEPLLERVFADYQTVKLARQLALMELNPADFHEVQNLLREFKTQAFADFAAKQNSKAVVLSRRWEKKINRAVQFYQTALSREENVLKKLKEFSQQKTETKTAMVFGGFHAPQLKDMFQRQGFSYVVIDPVISKISKRDSDLYRSLMAGDERLKTLPSAPALAKLSRTMSDFEWAASGLTTVTDLRLEISRRAAVVSAGARLSRSEVRSEGGASEKKPNPRSYIPEESITEVEDARWIEFFSGLIQLGYDVSKLEEVQKLFRQEAESTESRIAYFKMLAQAAAQPAGVMSFVATFLAVHPPEQWLSLLSHHRVYFYLRELLNLSRQQDGYQDAWSMVTQERVIEGEGIRFDIQMPAAFFEDGWYEETGDEIIRFTQDFLSRLAMMGSFHVRVANNVTALREDPSQVSLRGFDDRELELLEFTNAQRSMPILQIYRGEETGIRGMPVGILDVPVAFILQPKFEEGVLSLVDSGVEQLDITDIIEPLWLHEIYKKSGRKMSLREGSEVLAAWLAQIEKQIDVLKTQRDEKDLIFTVGIHQRAASISVYHVGHAEHVDELDQMIYLGQSFRSFDKKKWKTEWEDTRRSEMRASAIRGAVLTEPANGATLEPSSDGSVTVKFLLDLDPKPLGSFIPNMMINQLGLKAFLRYSSTNEFGQASPWSTPETDIPLEMTSGVHSWPFTFGSRYEVTAHFVPPTEAARLKFNIRLEMNSGEYWFQNGTPDNNWQISIAPPTPRWLISKDYSTRAEAAPAALQLEEKRDYGPSEQRWGESHFMTALRRRDTVGRALEGYYGSWSGLKGFYVYQIGGIDFIRILKFAEDLNQPRAGAFLFEDVLDRAGGVRVLVMHLAGDHPARLDSYEKLGFQVSRVEHLYGNGYPGYRLVANALPDSDLVKIFERSDRDAFLDYWTYEAARQLPLTVSQKTEITLLQNIRRILDDLVRHKESLVRSDPESLIRVLRSASIFFRRPALSEAEKDTLRPDITQLVLARLQGDILWLKKSSDDPLFFFNLRFYDLAMQIKPDANATKKEFLDALVGPYTNRMKTWIEHGRAPEEGLSELWQYRNQAMGIMEGWYKNGIFSLKDFKDYVKETDATLRPHALRLMSEVLYRVGIEDAAARVQTEDELWHFLEEDKQAKDQGVFLLEPPQPHGKFRRKKGEARVQLYPARVREVPYAVTHLMTGVMPGAREIALFPVYDGSYEPETIRVNHVIDALQYVRFYEIDYQGGKAFLVGDRQSDLYRTLAEVEGVKGRYDDWRWVQDLVLEFYARREGASAIIVPTAEAVKKRWTEISPKFVKFAYDTDMDLHGYTKQPLPNLPWEGGLTLTEGWVMPLDNDPAKLKQLETFLKPYPMASTGRSEVRSETNSALTILRGGQILKEDHSEEVLAIYDEDGNLKGAQGREEAHAASEWHAVSHVYLFDVHGRLLLQKRASHLQQSPGALQVSVSGHVASEEAPDLAALREGYEELGIHLDPLRLKKIAVLKKSYAYKADAAWQNREFAFIYVYQAADEEIAEIEKNYDRRESEELWLIPSEEMAGMVLQNPSQFSNSVRGVVNERPELWKVLSEKGTETPESDGRIPKSVLGLHEQTLISLRDYARFAELNSEKKAAIRNILSFLKQDNRSIRSMAYRTLRRIPQAAPFLLELASDEDPETASLAMISLSFLLRKRGLLPEAEEIQRAEIQEALFQRIERVLFPQSKAGTGAEDKGQTNLERSALQALGYLDHAETADLFVRKLAHIDRDNDEFGGSKLLEAVASSDSAGVRRKVLEAFARQARDLPIEKIPLELSRLLDARWVSEYLQDLPGLTLAKRFGYIDQALYKAVQAPEGEAIFPVIRKLIAQVGVATQTLTTRYLAEPEDSRETLVEGWRQKQLDWMRMFLPEELTPVPALQPVSVELTEAGEVDRDLFFGALRESDWANAEDKRETPPFGYEHQEKHGGRFYYAGRDLFQFLWDDKLKRAEATMGASVSADVVRVLKPYYAADAMAAETETRKEPREEAVARIAGRWRAVAGLLEVHEDRLILKPEIAKSISLEADLPRGQVGVSLEGRSALSDFISRLAAKRSVWKYALLDFQAMSRANLFMSRAQRDPDWKELSFGSRSVLKLYAYDLMRNKQSTNDELWPEWEAKLKQLAGEERQNRGVMPSLPLHGGKDKDADSAVGVMPSLPLHGGKDKDADSAVGVMPSLGMELQSVNVSPEQVYLWKQALSFFDIPSPERLRYGHIVETAFRPAWTASAFLLALPILHHMGLMGGEHYKSAAAFHISLSGDLGAEARWIALPLLMYRGDKSDKDLTLEERASRSAWVLSKGYIHLNRENQKADPESEAPQFHTEIRTARFANVEKGSDELHSDYEKFLPAVQHLGAALTAFNKAERSEVVLTDIEKALSQVWREYQAALSAMVSAIPEAQSLMNGDWYESTGDAKDAALVKQLDIFRRMVALFEYKKQNTEIYEGFAERVKKLFLAYADQAAAVVRSEVRGIPGESEDQPELSHLGYLRQLFEEADAQQMLERPRQNKDIVLDVFQGQRVLNMGLQTSRVTEKLSARNIVTYLRKRGVDTTGLDSQVQDDPANGLVNGRVEAMDFEKDSFDSAVSIGLFDEGFIEPLLRYRQRPLGPMALKDFYREVSQRLHHVLKDRGRFYLVFYSKPNVAFIEALTREGFVSVKGLTPAHSIFINRKSSGESVVAKKGRSEVRSSRGARERYTDKVFRQQPVFRKVMLGYQDLAENFTEKNRGRLKELAILAGRYPQVRFQIYDSDSNEAHYAEIQKFFKGMRNVQFQIQSGVIALSPADSSVTSMRGETVLHLSTQIFDTRQRFGVHTKEIRFMLTGSKQGMLAAALLYNPEHWLFRSRMSKQGDFWLLKSTLARLGREWLAGFVIASAA